MAQLVLLVVAAAWAAVLIPPMLRSRVENRPNSSVTDFRRQLNTLQSTSTPPRGSMRAIGRPLAQSPLHRPAAGGRPAHLHHRQASIHGPANVAPSRSAAPRGQAGFRTHGDPTGGHERPHRQMHVDRHGPTPAVRRPAGRPDVRRRRSNVLFLLVVTTACSLFLAATTNSTVMLYGFALSFLALCGYVYLLAQLRQRANSGWHDGWLEHH
jgi:hypothetical protein